MRIPPSGCSAVPLPKRKLQRSPSPAPAPAPDPTDDAKGSPGSRISLVAGSPANATDVAFEALRLPSRRTNSNAAHASEPPGPDSFDLPEPACPSHDSSPPATTTTSSDAAAAGGAAPTVGLPDDTDSGWTTATSAAECDSPTPSSGRLSALVTGVDCDGLLGAIRSAESSCSWGFFAEAGFAERPDATAVAPPVALEPDPDGELCDRSPDRDDECPDECPVEPPEPEVSANASAGNAAMAAPTPNATASAPTRPT